MKKSSGKRKALLILYAVILTVIIGGCLFLSSAIIGGFLGEHFLLTHETADIVTQKDPLLILVNRSHPLPEDYTPPLTECCGVQVHTLAADALSKMFAAAKQSGVTLTVHSAYRSRAEQQAELDEKIAAYREKGMFPFFAKKKAEQEVQRPGESEHQTGLALDLGGDADTDTEKAQQWLFDHAPEYGFILRYPAGKDKITGITYEPWHYRFVGIAAAKAITDAGMTLEEFTEEAER